MIAVVDMDCLCWIKSAAGIIGRAATFGEAELRRLAFPSWSLGTSEDTGSGKTPYQWHGLGDSLVEIPIDRAFRFC